jgi:hypothetical protein
MQGQSLLPIMRGGADKIRDYAIVGYHGFSQLLQMLIGLIELSCR